MSLQPACDCGAMHVRKTVRFQSQSPEHLRKDPQAPTRGRPERKLFVIVLDFSLDFSFVNLILPAMQAAARATPVAIRLASSS